MKKIAYRQMYENEITHFWYITTRNLMIDFLKKSLREDAKILDAGCGTGGTMIYLEKVGFKNIVGVDESLEALKYCRKRNLKNIKLASVNKLPFKDESFDAVICLDVLYHKGVQSKKALSEFKRVLKPKGLVYLQEPAYNWLKSKHDKAIETENRFTKTSLFNLIKLTDLKVLKISYFNTLLLLPIFLKRLKDKFHPSKSKSSDVYRLPKIINQTVLLIMMLESKLVKNFYLPWGLSIICIAKK